MFRTRTLSLALLALIVALGIFSGSRSSSAISADSLAYLYSGYAQISGTLQLDVYVSPAVAAPGETLTLTVLLSNQEQVAHTPQISLALPDGVRVGDGLLPRGTTYSLQANTLGWQPLVNGNGGTAQTAVLLTAQEPLSLDVPAEQTLTISLQSGNQVRTADLQLWVGTPPSGSIDSTTLSASVGQPLDLRASPAGQGPFTQVWNLGDGRIVSAANPTVVYPRTGSYEVELLLANPIGTHTSRATVDIVPDPVSFFSMSDSTPALGQSVQFVSQGGGEGPLSYLWDLGDGSFSTEANPIHTYGRPGTYPVTLNISNAYGSAENYATITVGKVPLADMQLPAAGFVDQPVVGQALVSENTKEVLWDMGDGRTYSGTLVEHAYLGGGEYLVTMTARNDYGDAVVSRIVSVSSDGSRIFLPLIMTNSGDLLTLDGEAVTPTIDFVENNREIVLEADPLIDALSFEEQVAYYINEARRQAEVNEVVLDDLLSAAAKVHTNDMASNLFTSHTGSDGSAPYERIARLGYRSGGYAGEATAWGFSNGREAVDFWLDSPPHRAIILNPLATQFGVAETTNFNSPSIWYWTAEFASSYGSIEGQMLEAGIRLLEPAEGQAADFADGALTFGWVWPLQLNPDERLRLSISKLDGSAERPLATIGLTNPSSIYTTTVPLMELANFAGDYSWQVTLLDANGNPLTGSQTRQLSITGLFPSPTPTATPLTLTPTTTPPPIGPTALPTLKPTIGAPTATATPLPVGSPQPTPTLDGSATPLPSATPTPEGSPTPSATPLPPTATPTPTSTKVVIPIQPTSTP